MSTEEKKTGLQGIGGRQSKVGEEEKRVVNIGNYEVEEEEKANQADRGPQVEGEETDYLLFTFTFFFRLYR